MITRRQTIVGSLALLSGTGFERPRLRTARSPQVLQRSRRLDGETVALRDYCAADGRGSDSANLQELINLRPSVILYPEGARVMLDHAIRLASDQTHRFGSDVRIVSYIDGFALEGVGLTAQPLSGLSAPINRGDRIIRMSSIGDLTSGDLVVLADISDPTASMLDINLIARVGLGSLKTRFPIGRSFEHTPNFRLYRVYAPLGNLRLLGSAIGTNHHPRGGFLRLNTARDVTVEGLSVDTTGYIAVAFENGLGARFAGLSISNAGASALGFRVGKVIEIDRFKATGTRADESLTFYQNVSDVKASRIDIEQYLFAERGRGQSAGNDILIDSACARIALSDIRCTGSSTYNIMIHNECNDCSIENFELRRSNLGGIRISRRCIGTRIGYGIIADVRDQIDQEARKAVSAISVGRDCQDTVIDPNVQYEAIATGLRIGSIEGDTMGTKR